LAEIVIAEFMDAAAVASLAADHDVLFDPGMVDELPKLLDELADCRALIVRNRTQVRGALLEAAPRLLVVGRLGVGLDNIDVDACRARGIEVFPATGANDLSVAEYVLTASLMLLRGAWQAQAEMLTGGWPRGRLMGRELAGKTMGLVGLGSIAREVASRAAALGMRLAAYDPYVTAEQPIWSEVERLELEPLLMTADVISLHVPLTSQTHHLIGARALAAMKADAVLINAARGGVVDEAALAETLRAGRLGGAALDVFETEPLTADAAGRFNGLPNLILTPHIAGVTVESNVRVSDLVAGKVRSALATRRA
jgi:(S)-sulfolactate dehydrogenase